MPSFQITERIKQDVRNARFIGEFTFGAEQLDTGADRKHGFHEPGPEQRV